MTQSAAQLVVTLFEGYVAVGVVFAAPFVWRLAARLDPAAGQGTVGFRLLVFPGAVALWPYLLIRLAAGAAAPPDEWTAHRRAAR